MSNLQQSISRVSAGLLGAAALVVIVAAAIFVVRTAGEQPESSGKSAETVQLPPAAFAEGSGTLAIGDKAWHFQTVDVNGNAVALSDYSGRPIIMNYWASWCGPCRIEFPHLQAAYDQYRDAGVVLLAINQQEDAETAIDFFQELGLTFTPLLDQDGAVGRQYQIGRTLPTTFFINAAGEVVAIHRGPMTFGQIEGYLADTLATP